MSRALALLIVVLMAPSFAQLSYGDIVFSNGGPNEFAVSDPSGNVSVYGLSGVPTPGLALCVLWDPANPDDVILGGNGWLGRATVGTGGQASFTLLATGMAGIVQMSWDEQGQIVIITSTGTTLSTVDPLSGVVTPVATLPLAAGPYANCGVFDPDTGDVFVGTSGGSIWRYSQGAFNIFTGASPGEPFAVQELTTDPLSPDLVAVLGSGRIVRIWPNGAYNDLIPPGKIPLPFAVTQDVTSGFLVSALPSAQLWRTQNAGGGIVQVPVDPPNGGIPSLSVVGVTGNPFRLHVQTESPSTLSFSLRGTPAAAITGWTLVSGDTSAPLGLGPAAGITPDPLSYALLAALPTPAVGNPFHWFANTPSVYPDVGFVFPDLTTAGLGGIELDFVALAIGGLGDVVGVSSVARLALP